MGSQWRERLVLCYHRSIRARTLQAHKMSVTGWPRRGSSRARAGPSLAGVLLPARVPQPVPGGTVGAWRWRSSRRWSSVHHVQGFALRRLPTQTKSVAPSASPPSSTICRFNRTTNPQLKRSSGAAEPLNIYPPRPQRRPDLLKFTLKSVGQSLFTFTSRMSVTRARASAARSCSVCRYSWRVLWMEYTASFHPRI